MMPKWGLTIITYGLCGQISFHAIAALEEAEVIAAVTAAAAAAIVLFASSRVATAQEQRAYSAACSPNPYLALTLRRSKQQTLPVRRRLPAPSTPTYAASGMYVVDDVRLT
jgi:hypothetical protein